MADSVRQSILDGSTFRKTLSLQNIYEQQTPAATLVVKQGGGQHFF